MMVINYVEKKEIVLFSQNTFFDQFHAVIIFFYHQNNMNYIPKKLFAYFMDHTFHTQIFH
jgi:hypothetical protein